MLVSLVWTTPALRAKSHLAGTTGRVRARSDRKIFAAGQEPVLDIDVVTRASRYHPATIAALVVGAMGVFVFTIALRHWLGERRARTAPAEDAPSESGLWPE